MQIIPVKIAFDKEEMELLHNSLESQMSNEGYHGKQLRDGSWYGGMKRTLYGSSMFKWDKEDDIVWFPYYQGGGAQGFKLADIQQYFTNHGLFKGKRYQLNGNDKQNRKETANVL